MCDIKTRFTVNQAQSLCSTEVRMYSRCVIHTALFVLGGGENSLCEGGFAYTTSRICQSTVNLFAWPMNPMSNSFVGLASTPLKDRAALYDCFFFTVPRWAVYNVTCCFFLKLSHSKWGVICSEQTDVAWWNSAEISISRIFKFKSLLLRMDNKF